MKRKRAHRLGNAVRISWLLVRFALRAIAMAWHVVFGALSLTRRGGLVLYDASKARHSLREGALTCPRGHSLVTEGADVVFSCAKCGFVYEDGSAWICSNPECQAVTPYINCACGLSVRNPFRWGRP